MNKFENKKIAIIGSGALGTSLAKILYDGHHHNIIIFGVDTKELEELTQGLNTRYFPELKMHIGFKTTTDLKTAVMGADYVVLAVPSKIMNLVVPDIIKHLDSETLIINGSKGFYPNSNFSLHEGIANASKDCKFVRDVVSLVGPSHAEEMVEEKPTIVTAVNDNIDLCLEVQQLFTNQYFRVYAQTDVKGAMACSAFKNVLAIASGMVAGLGGGINSTAALLTRGLVEMTKFVKIQGGNEKTVMGLTGVGDLIVTATSDLSRNYSTGKSIALNGVDAIPANTTVEGLEALKFIYKIAKDANEELPIVNFLYETIVTKKLQPSDFKAVLWSRQLKEE